MGRLLSRHANDLRHNRVAKTSCSGLLSGPMSLIRWQVRCDKVGAGSALIASRSAKVPIYSISGNFTITGRCAT